MGLGVIMSCSNSSGKSHDHYEKNKNHAGFATWMMQQSTSQKKNVSSSKKKK